jgi:hypothetical protein
MTNIFALVISILTALFSSCGPTTNSSSQKFIALSDEIKIKVGKEPSCVEVADLNNDKLPDLIVANQQDSSVSILLGNGKGRFQEAGGSPFPAGYSVNDVAIGDFNKDGNRDLAFANHERKYFTVLLGNGRGSFTPAPKSPFPVAGIPHVHGIATGDFNRDGRLDIVTDSWGDDKVEVIFGDSVHLFKTSGVFIKVGKRPYQRHRVADLNDDGMDDIVTTNTESNNATVLLTNGKGGFNETVGSPFPCGDNPFGIAIGDINADGKPDLAIINSPGSMAGGHGRNGLTVLFGDGTGKFTTMKGSPYEAGKIPSRVAIGDVNGDGVNDIVTSDNDSNKIHLFIMDKNGGVLSQSAITVGNHPKGVAIANLNGDEKGDIVVCNNSDNDISIIISK